MIEFSIVIGFEQGYFNGLCTFVGMDDGTGLADWHGVGLWAKYKHLSDGIIIKEDAVQVSRFDAICEN